MHGVLWIVSTALHSQEYVANATFKLCPSVEDQQNQPSYAIHWDKKKEPFVSIGSYLTSFIGRQLLNWVLLL